MSDPTRSERLASAYKRLVSSAQALNDASDEFSKPIGEIEAALQKLNVGLITWQRVSTGADDDDNWWTHEVGYTKWNREWVIAIRSSSGNHRHDDDTDSEIWPFRDAPRSYRIEAIDKLPELLEELIKNAEKTTKKLHEKAIEARELADALKEAAKPPVKGRRL